MEWETFISGLFTEGQLCGRSCASCRGIQRRTRHHSLMEGTHWQGERWRVQVGVERGQHQLSNWEIQGRTSRLGPLLWLWQKNCTDSLQGCRGVLGTSNWMSVPWRLRLLGPRSNGLWGPRGSDTQKSRVHFLRGTIKWLDVHCFFCLYYVFLE